ncbi:MAG: protocatechuate 3,4-dioxygenase beta subunit [Oceanicoccus sp.]|jgi:protocatechuate 3,4-dioxygenase beta subunit
MNRRNFFKASLLSTLGVAGHAMSNDGEFKKTPSTPNEIEGPFYPIIAQKDKDFDLTNIKGRNQDAIGKKIIIHGVVLDTEGNPVEDATVDLWQANAAGRYAHPHDSNPAPIDDNFQGWAIVPSGKNGEFRFKTIQPGIYPVGNGWSRPPHIHFKVTKKGYFELTTQMYFPNHPLNQVDRLLQRKTKQEQALMIAKESADKTGVFYYQIVIEKA